MEEAIRAMLRRQQAQDPLFMALTQLGTNLLPRSAYQKYPGREYGTLSGHSPITANTPMIQTQSMGRVPARGSDTAPVGSPATQGLEPNRIGDRLPPKPDESRYADPSIWS
jgi:hypothetical protein